MLDQKPGIKRVVVHCSEPWVEKTIAPDKPTKIIATKRRFDVADNAVKALDESVPDFMMIYQVFVDKVGHDFGWESERYVRSIDTLDTYIGHVLNGYRNKGLLDRTLVILISDHGGIGLDHGKANPEEVLVPLVFAGPGVKKGGTIDGPVNGFDFAPTMAAIFQLETPDCWIGKPLRNAFEGAKIPIISVDKK